MDWPAGAVAQAAVSGDVHASTHACTYAIGDLHGERTLLRGLLKLIQPRPQDTVVFLGDYLDRGEDSVGTVRDLLALVRTAAFACVFLRGNHDAAWLEVWDRERAQFVARPAIPGSRMVWEAWAAGERAGEGEGKGDGVPAEVGHFLAGTVTAYEDEYAYYVHAAARPGVPFWQTPEEERLWGSASFLSSPYDWGKPVVFGHVEFHEPLLTPTKIGVDTAAYRRGVLTAVRLPDRRLFQVRSAPPWSLSPATRAGRG